MGANIEDINLFPTRLCGLGANGNSSGNDWAHSVKFIRSSHNVLTFPRLRFLLNSTIWGLWRCRCQRYISSIHKLVAIRTSPSYITNSPFQLGF